MTIACGQNIRRGYTVVELMVTVVIVAVLVATVGVCFVKLLALREDEHDEAYVREKLVDICGIYADYLSVGSTFGNDTRGFAVLYPAETGGVSLETGRVTRVSQLKSFVNQNNAIDLNVFAFEQGTLLSRFSRTLRGDAWLRPLTNDIVNLTIKPIGIDRIEDAALGYLEITAKYETNKVNHLSTTISAGRVVRLWNRE